MHVLSTIRVMPIDESVPRALLRLCVLPAQREWVGPIDNLLADAARCPGSESLAIAHGDTPVGYYRIEPTARRVAGRDFDVPALELRTVFIDADWRPRLRRAVPWRPFRSPALVAAATSLSSTACETTCARLPARLHRTLPAT